MFTHGDAVGGLASSIGTLGFAASPSFSSNGSLLSTMPLHGANGAIPSFTGAAGVGSGPQYGTGYTTTTGYTGTPSSMGYVDPYLGSRAPEYINWSFGLQRQLTNAITATATYVGSEGHFLQTDGSNARGFWADQLDPKYLYLGSTLSSAGTSACAANGLTCPANFTTSQNLSAALKPFPFQTVGDSFGYVGNANYHGLQVLVNMRAWHGLTLNGNYTWARAIDDGGTFRSGYALPAGTVANSSKAYKADAIERTVSTTNQPQHLVLTGVWNMPFGRTVLAQNNIERTVIGGFKFSGVYQAYSGSPLAVTGSACQTNPAQSTCAPTLNPNFTGSARQNGKWGKGVTWANYNSTSNAGSYFVVPSVGGVAGGNATVSGPFIAPVAPTGQTSLLNTAAAPAYTFGNSPRTAPYNLYGPGNYQLDLAMVRTFPLHITETSKLNFRAEWYNVTNHTLFAVASTAVGNANFGQVTSTTAATRKAAQFSMRIEF